MFKKILVVFSLSLAMAFGAYGQGTSSTASTAKAVEPTKKPPVFRPTKDQIKEVQTMLKEKKLYTGEASGTYNDDTRTGIKSFQKDNGLNPTGTLNRATLEKFGVELTETQKASPVLDSSFAKPASESKAEKTSSTASKTTKSSSTGPKRPAPFRANADQIKAVQKLMKDGKMYAGEETGKLDDATREALGKYQGANGLKVTKTLNAVTLEKMGIALTDAQKQNVAAQAAYDESRKN